MLTAEQHTEIGRRVRAWRTVKGLKQNELASVVGIDPSSLSKIEQGKKPLNMAMALALRQRFGLCLNFLYAGDYSSLPAKFATDLQAELETSRPGGKAGH